MAKNDPKWPKRASSSIMECEVFILPDWSPPDNPIQSERASSSIMECEEFILPDWSPFDDPARVLAAEGRRNPSDHNDRNCDQQRFSILTLLHCGGKYLQGKVNLPKLIIGGKVKVKKRTFQNCSCSMINCVGGKLKVKEPTINIGVDQNIIHLN